ncbi:hypothetical protein P3T18_001194 [Paraburkholderia sp. GAS199]|uniref:hypothetical protein n=1 Tax=Paraburkholderia sp. GAS199 TaxID=3035126 RepID=UPI003D193C72
MNLLVERDIAHVGRVMRVSIMTCAPQAPLVNYWRRRVTSLMGEEHLAKLQLSALQDLLAELTDIEIQLAQMRSTRLQEQTLVADVNSAGQKIKLA